LSARDDNVAGIAQRCDPKQLLEVRNVSQRFCNIVALNNVSFEIG